MREITTEKIITEVTGYEAGDGIVFKSKEECEKYEQSAEYVLRQGYVKHIVAQTNEYDLFDYGCEDSNIDVLEINTREDLDEINRYIYFKNGGKERSNLIPEEYIGEKNVIKFLEYAWCDTEKPINEFYGTTTMSEYLKGCQRRLERVLEKAKENK